VRQKGLTSCLVQALQLVKITHICSRSKGVLAALCADHSMRLKDFGLASGMAHCRLECYSLLNSIQVSALFLTLCLFQSCQLCSLTRIGALVLCWWSDKTVQPLHYNLSLLSFFSPENMARLGVGDSPVFKGRLASLVSIV